MKAISHGLVALKAIERLEKAKLTKYRDEADSLVHWLRDHRDGVIPGAWYPDEVFKDMANSHVLKIVPDRSGVKDQYHLPSVSLLYKAGRESSVWGKPYRVDPADNLPLRCEAWAHSIVDHLKIKETEHPDSPVTSTGNHIALSMFILCHYVADAHMPLHCDGRAFSSGKDLHDAIEGTWEREVLTHFQVDEAEQRFHCDSDGHLLWTDADHSGSFLQEVEDVLAKRPFPITYGENNSCVAEYMRAICQYSYLTSYRFIPPRYDEKTVDMKHWQALPDSSLPFHRLSVIAFSDAIDATARIWLRTWCRYLEWKSKHR